MTTSRIPGFRQLPVAARRQRLAEARGRPGRELGPPPLRVEAADQMVENALGTFACPLGVALNFRVDGRDRLVPMAVEEPSVIAAASSAALLARAGGGFTADTDPSVMIGQIQLVDVADPARAARRLRGARARLLAAAAALTPGLCRRGGGPRGLEVRRLRGPDAGAMLVVHLLLDTGDAMGANAVNTLVEALAPLVAGIARARAHLRIVSNLADRRLARAAVAIPFDALARDGLDGAAVAERIVCAHRFAAADPYRAATHNKGIMNGVDAVALATGNDWRAIEAGAHAYAARRGRYAPLSAWSTGDGVLHGRIELPLALSTVGPLVRLHPHVRWALRLLEVERARELAGIVAAVGLASNLAALRALATEGIQRGHMALHARAVALAAGARGAQADEVRRRLLAAGEVKIDRARGLVRALDAVTTPLVRPPGYRSRRAAAR